MVVADVAVGGGVVGHQLTVDADGAELFLNDLGLGEEVGDVGADQNPEHVAVGPAGLFKKRFRGFGVVLVVLLAAGVREPGGRALEHVGGIELVAVGAGIGGEHHVFAVDDGLNRLAHQRVGGDALGLVEDQHGQLRLGGEDGEVLIVHKGVIVVTVEAVGDVKLAGLDAGDDSGVVAGEVEVHFVIPGGLVAAPAGVVAFGAVGLIVGVGLQTDELIGFPLVKDIGAGADVFLYQLAFTDRADDGSGHDDGLLAEAGDHLVEVEGAVFHRDFNRIVVHRGEVGAAHQRGGVGRGVDPAVHGGHDVGGFHLFPVVEENTLTQVIGVDGVVLVDFPGFREFGDDLTLAVEGDELFKDRAEDNLGCHVHAAHGDIQMLRLAVEGDVQDTVVRGEGGRREDRADGQAQDERQHEGEYVFHVFPPWVQSDPRTDFPARRSRMTPSRRTGFPPTKTSSIPAGGIRGSAKVARSISFSGSKITTSASAPTESRPFWVRPS